MVAHPLQGALDLENQLVEKNIEHTRRQASRQGGVPGRQAGLFVLERLTVECAVLEVYEETDGSTNPCENGSSLATEHAAATRQRNSAGMRPGSEIWDLRMHSLLESQESVCHLERGRIASMALSVQ